MGDIVTRPQREEGWRPIPGFPNYEASDQGRLRRKASATPRGVARIIKPKVRTAPAAKIRYHEVCLHHEGRRSMQYVARLVCLAFHGPPPTPKHQAAHDNGDVDDNAPSNVLWKTPVENHADKLRHGTAIFGEAVHSARLDPDRVLQMRRRRQAGETVTSLAKEYGVSLTCASRVTNGVDWKRVPAL